MIKREAIGLLLALAAAIGSALLLAGSQTAGLIVWLLAWAYAARKMLRPALKGRWVRPISRFVSVRLILTAGLAAPLVESSSPDEPPQAWAGWCVVVVLAVLVRSEGIVRRAITYQGFRVADLPGLSIRLRDDRPVKAFFLAQVFTPPILALLGVTGISALVWFLPILVTLVSLVWIFEDARQRRRLSRAGHEAVPEVLAELEPQFVAYWDAPRNSGYELAMWVPQLQRLGLPFFIMVRSVGGFNEALRFSDGVPVVMARSLKDLERLVVPSLRAAFYVNNGAKNTHLVRYIDLTHVQLLHGDSDKAASFNPVTAMYDKVFVAGQAGIDRYSAHGVHIPQEKFEIVGRPQVEGIEPVQPRAADEPLTVLYAPTWRGHTEVASYSSVPVILPLFDELIRRGCRIVFRPHPLSYRDAEYKALIAEARARLEADNEARGVGHLFGEIAEREMGLVECFNASDAMISDVSGVVVDYLYSRKPFAIMNGGRGEEEFAAEFPLATVGYVMSPDPSTWHGPLADLLERDPMAAKRQQAREHYLGPFPDEGYADAFVSAAREVVRSRPAPHL